MSLLRQWKRLLLLAASMLAPEDVFAGKGDVKEAAELTQSERKRRCPPRKGDIKGKRGISMVKILLSNQSRRIRREA